MGDEYEIYIYARMVSKGVIKEVFLKIGSPKSSCADHIYESLNVSLDEYFISDEWKKVMNYLFRTNYYIDHIYRDH